MKCPTCKQGLDTSLATLVLKRSGQVIIGDKRVTLGGSEYRIVCLLAEKAGHLVSYERLIHGLWGHDSQGGPSRPRAQLDVIVSRIRGKLGHDLIQNVYGEGLALLAPARDARRET